MGTKKREIQPQPKTRSPTAFEQRLYEACKKIPKGKVTTYGALAKVLNSSARAVGQGMRRNPFAPVVPCHRVVASDLQIGGFYGSWGEHTDLGKRKKSMLEDEGIAFSAQQQQCKVASISFVLDSEELRSLCVDINLQK